MKALVFERNVARFAAARVAGEVAAGGGARVGPLRLTDVDTPDPSSAGWVRVRPRLAGICGSDLSTIDGKSSRYFEPIVSFPFTPGHEVVGDLDDGSRAVVVPVLSCAVRGVDPVCGGCEDGRINLCERIAYGHLEPGLQTGFCTDTGGGWSTAMLAGPGQTVAVPEDLSDEDAVMVEPAACAVHAAASVDADGPVVVLGAGTLGLLTVAALERPGVIAAAKYPHQRDWAARLGADDVVGPEEIARFVRSRTGSLVAGDQLTGGVPTVIDCVGSSESLTQALRIVAPGGTVVLVGMAGVTRLDLTSLWHREVAIRGAYAYTHTDFASALDLVSARGLGRLVTAKYPLADYKAAIAHAADAGRRGAVKIAFDLRDENERERI